MKKIIFLLSTLFILLCNINAQTETDGRKEQVEKIVVAYITKKLDLTVDEAQQFWPVYNKYTSDLRASVKDIKDDEIKRSEAILTVQKKYKPEFQRVLKTEVRANRVFVITKNLKDMMEKRRNNGGQPPVRPRRAGAKLT